MVYIYCLSVFEEVAVRRSATKFGFVYRSKHSFITFDTPVYTVRLYICICIVLRCVLLEDLQRTYYYCTIYIHKEKYIYIIVNVYMYRYIPCSHTVLHQNHPGRYQIICVWSVRFGTAHPLIAPH